MQRGEENKRREERKKMTKNNSENKGDPNPVE